MANILGLALKVTGDASGLAKSLTPVDRALDNLAKQADRATAVFKPLTDASAGAARAQEQFAEKFANLAAQLKAQVIGPQEYAAAFGQLTEEAQMAADAFERGIEITQRYTTAEENRAAQLREIADLLEQGAISEQTAARARADLSGENARSAEAAAEAEKRLAALRQDAVRVTESVTTEQEKRQASLQRLQELQQSGLISEETYRRAVEKTTGVTAAAEKAEAEAASKRAALVADAQRITQSVTTDQERRQAALDKLNEVLKAGLISEETYQRAVEKTSGASAAAEQAERDRQALLEEGRRVAESVATVEEKRTAEIQRLQQLLDAGAISQETFARASAEASGANEAAALAERQRADAIAAAARITAANMSPMEFYDKQVQELTQHLAAGRINQETFDRAVAKATATFTKAESAAKGYDKTVDGVGLKFNELSGILSAIPGPIGNFAGRLSGLSSAGEGLARVFANGLTPGLASISTSLASVINPATLAAAGLAGIGAAATAVVRGLSSLEAETERLQNAADKLGVSFGFIQTLEQAAKMSGVSFESVNSAMTKLLKTLAGADEESKAATAALGRLGVTLDDLAGKGSEEQLRLIGERLQGIEDPAKRAAAATAIFGKSGAELLPFFNNLGIAEQTLNRFNARLSEIDVARVLGLGDAFDAVKASLAGVGNELLTPFIGITQSLSEGLASAIATFGRNIGAVLDIFSPLTSAVGAAGNLFLQFGATLGNLIGTVLEPFAAAGRLISGAIDTISQTITGVAGRINDAIIRFREFFKFEGLAAQFRDTFSQIGDVVSRVATIVTTALSQLGDVVGKTIGRATDIAATAVSQFLEFTGIGDVVSTFASTVGEAFSGLWDSIKDVVGRVGGFIEQVMQFAEEWLGIVPQIEQPVVATVEVNDGGVIAELVAESKTLEGTIQKINGSVSEAINESARFGQAGFDAALKYQTAVNELKDQLDRGLFNEETFRREAEKAGVAFKEELAKIEEGSKLDIQINADAEKTLAGLQDRINKAIEGAQEFGQAGFDAAARFQDKLRDLGEQFSDARINATTLADEVAKATAEYDKQIAGIQQIQELQKATLEADKDRVKQLLDESKARSQIENDIDTVLREQARLEEEIRRQREAGEVFAADAAAARLAQLDQLQAKLEEEQQAIEQGFGDGFAKAFESTNKGIDALVVKAEQFGTVGAFAAQALQDGIARAQEQAKAGILTQETYEREVAQQRDIFQQRLDAAQRVEEFLRNGVDARQQAELKATDELEKRKKQAAINVQAIEAKLIEQRQQLEQAREDGDLRGAKAAKARITALERVQRQEQQLADGRIQQQRQISQQFVAGLGAGQQAQQQQLAQYNNAVATSLSNANAAFAAFAQFQAQQARKMEELLTPTNRVAQTADIRTAEGQQLLLNLAQGGQDPALVEARLQTKQLQLIAQGIIAASQNYFNQPVAIVGGA